MGTSRKVSDRLRGAAPKGAYVAKTIGGELKKEFDAVFPIFKQNLTDGLSLVGTGFYVGGGGLLLTAKHVLFDVLDKGGKQNAGLALMHMFAEHNAYLFRRILRSWNSPNSDVSLAICEQATHNESGAALISSSLRLTTKLPSIGSTIVTYAYPNTSVERIDKKTLVKMQPDYYEGALEEYLPNGRDSFLLPWPCFRTSMHIHGGASGGPVIDARSGNVFGINCTSFSGVENISYVVPIRTILSAYLEDIRFSDKESGRRVSLREFVARQEVAFDPPLSDADFESGA